MVCFQQFNFYLWPQPIVPIPNFRVRKSSTASMNISTLMQFKMRIHLQVKLFWIFCWTTTISWKELNLWNIISSWTKWVNPDFY
jgi:hypothetical protein